MTLGFEQRRALRLALDEQRRLDLARVSRVEARKLARCPAVALSGRPCRNLPGPSGLCGVHVRSHAA